MTLDYTKMNYSSRAASATQVRDVGLRSFLIGIYKYMTLALVLTGFVAYAIVSVEPISRVVFLSPLYLILILSPFFIVVYLNLRLQSMSLSTARMWFWVYSAVMGASMASVLMVYTSYSVAKVFFIAASTFGAMSIYGYTTKRDLTSIGSFMFMGVIGIIIASLINIFLRSPGLDFVISGLGVLIFTGLTAYDIQKIKDMYITYEGHIGNEDMGKIAIRGALTLYLDFINLFLSLLRLFGDRR